MREVINKYNVYEFDELSAESKEKALEKYWDINVNYYWEEFIIDEVKAELESYGFEDVEIYYSGFWSQGDGASFTGRLSDIRKFMKANKISNKYKMVYLYADEVSADIIRNTSHYYHENTIFADVEYYNAEDFLSINKADKLLDQLSEFEEYLQDWSRDYSANIYRKLRREFEYLTDEEQIIETFRANEYEFTENGEIA